MMTGRACPGSSCGRPIRGHVTICPTCTRALSRALGDVPWLIDELETSLTRQRATPLTGTTSHGSSSSPLPWDETAARALRNLARVLRDAERLYGLTTAPGSPVAAVSGRLLAYVDVIARHDNAPSTLDAIIGAVTRAERVVFWKRRSRIYLGPCAYGEGLADQLNDCPGDVYADEGEPVGYCLECKRAVTVVIRQDKLDQDLRSRLLTAAEIADWAMRMGLDAKRDEVRKRVLYWHRHDRIAAHGHEQRGSTKIPLFRYGDVRALLDTEYGQAS